MHQPENLENLEKGRHKEHFSNTQTNMSEVRIIGLLIPKLSAPPNPRSLNGPPESANSFPPSGTAHAVAKNGQLGRDAPLSKGLLVR